VAARRICVRSAVLDHLTGPIGATAERRVSGAFQSICPAFLGLYFDGYKRILLKRCPSGKHV
jgi:hypothetical protein